MAVDEALSLCVDGGPPVVRFYGFSSPTISVGRFQRAKQAFDLEGLRRDGISFVRRPTGGQAVLHDNEMTYSVILSRSHITPFRKRAVYRFLSEVLIEGLQNLGISADFSRTRMGSFQNPDCFGTTGQFEIVTSSGRKIIGSAQSTSRVSCLQHGSIPLTKSQMRLASYFIDAPSHANTDSTSIGEELGRQVDLAKVVEAFYRAFDRVFTLKPSEMTQRERTLAAELFKTKYLSSTWNLKL